MGTSGRNWYTSTHRDLVGGNGRVLNIFGAAACADLPSAFSP